MKRTPLISLGLGLAALAVMVLLWPSQNAPTEIVRLSESLLISKVHDYYRNPSESTLAAVRDTIANHKKVIDRAELPRESREAAAENLRQQLSIVRGIARNDHLKL